MRVPVLPLAGGLCALLLVAADVGGCSQLAGTLGPPAYYISPAGNDAAAGTSPDRAWRTLGRVSEAILRPGTRVLLEGGRQFRGELKLGPPDGGDAARPVRVGSYGHGRATIVSSGLPGIAVFDTAGINIADIAIRGTGRNTREAGINVYSDLPGNRKLDHIVISHVDVSGFANGIAIGGGNQATGFRNVWVSDSVLHGNSSNGLLTYGTLFRPDTPNYANANVHVTHVVAYGNHGDPADILRNSGSGIVIGSTRNAIVSWSVAHDNGGLGGDPHEGPQGIWAYDSKGIVIEHNLSYANRSINSVDGGGFDLDQNVSDSRLQYNLSYGNDGPGYLLYTRERGNAHTGNVVRFNISSGDVRAGGRYGGISVIGHISDTAIYQNTVVMARVPGTQAGVALRLGRGLRQVTARNNIFVTSQPGPIVFSEGLLTRSAVLLQGNDYFSYAGRWQIRWGGIPYPALAAWQAATGQETGLSGTTGLAVAPDLAGPVSGVLATHPGAAGGGFRLRQGSPLAGAGLSLTRTYHIRADPADYSGQPMNARAPDIGAQ